MLKGLKKSIFVLGLCFFTVVYACSKSDDEELSNPNTRPIANAGSDIVLTIEIGNTTKVVTLDGSASTDQEGPISSYDWKLNNTSIATTKIADVTLEEGVHIIVLTVTDSEGLTDSDEVRVELKLQQEYRAIDANATEKTNKLFTNLAAIANGTQFIFGQEFPLSFQLNSIRHDLSTSDCKDVSGDHPGVYGIDPHYMLYKTAEQRQTHINESKHAYENGSVVTFDFHQQSKSDHKIYMNDITTETDKSIMYDVVNDLNDSRAWFYGELDEIIDIVNNELDFPIVFRLFHEMDGHWFWWGTSATNHSTQLYIDFYRLSVDYIKERTNLVLFAWSPSNEVNLDYYPGDNYVDVVGFDIYQPEKEDLKTKLIELSTFASDHYKVAILAETGHGDNYIINDPTFWTSTILAAIEEGGSDVKIAWVLSWFNAPWVSSQSDLFIPNSVSSDVAKNDFIDLRGSNTTLFQEEVKDLNIYE